MQDMSGIDIEALFAAGAYSEAMTRGMSKEAAESFAVGLCRDVKSGMAKWAEDDDDDDNSTFWSRNKKWLLPLMVGTGAFFVGADTGRWGRPDRNYVSGTLDRLGDRLKMLLGIPLDPVYNAFARAPYYQRGSTYHSGPEDKPASGGAKPADMPKWELPQNATAEDTSNFWAAADGV